MFGRQEFSAMLRLFALCYDFFPSFMDLYGRCLRTITHLLMLGTELEAVAADTVSFELCISSYH